MEDIQVTCLHEHHVKLGAKMVPFAGFDMPIEYSSIVDEHNAVRHHCGIFDVSHMGEIMISGEDAEKFVNHIFTNDIRGGEPGKIYYGVMCYPNGTAVDDLLVYKVSNTEYYLVVNAANIDKDDAWMRDARKGFDIAIENVSDAIGQVAVQGPEAESVVERVLGITVSDIEFYKFKDIDYKNEMLRVSRTGYTGEDGFEIYATHETTCEIWEALIAAGVVPCGLGCRDTLRFEVGLPLYGHELSDAITPIEAGLGIFVKLDKPEFIGKEALAQQKAEGLKQRVVGIELADKAIPRAGYDIIADDKVIGKVTTGYNSISTGKSVAMVLIDAAYGKIGTPVEVQIRKKRFAGVVTKKRFFDKNYKK